MGAVKAASLSNLRINQATIQCQVSKHLVGVTLLTSVCENKIRMTLKVVFLAPTAVTVKKTIYRL